MVGGLRRQQVTYPQKPFNISSQNHLFIRRRKGRQGVRVKSQLGKICSPVAIFLALLYLLINNSFSAPQAQIPSLSLVYPLGHKAELLVDFL